MVPGLSPVITTPSPKRNEKSAIVGIIARASREAISSRMSFSSSGPANGHLRLIESRVGAGGSQNPAARTAAERPSFTFRVSIPASAHPPAATTRSPATPFLHHPTLSHQQAITPQTPPPPPPPTPPP